MCVRDLSSPQETSTTSKSNLFGHTQPTRLRFFSWTSFHQHISLPSHPANTLLNGSSTFNLVFARTSSTPLRTLWCLLYGSHTAPVMKLQRRALLFLRPLTVYMIDYGLRGRGGHLAHAAVEFRDAGSQADRLHELSSRRRLRSRHLDPLHRDPCNMCSGSSDKAVCRVRPGVPLHGVGR